MAEKNPAQGSAFYALIGRALVDEEYRERIMDQKQHPEVLKEVLGRTPTAEDLAAYRKALDAVADLSSMFGLRPYSA
jgi:hypothetical protein